jgi:hypothetical protein
MNNEWISLMTKYPEIGMDVMTIDIYGNLGREKITQCVSCRCGATLFERADGGFNEYVKYWMPLQPLRCAEMYLFVTDPPARCEKEFGHAGVCGEGVEWFRSADARVWAQKFMEINAQKNIAADEGAMLGWFANAIMAGYDKGYEKGVEVQKRYERGKKV